MSIGTSGIPLAHYSTTISVWEAHTHTHRTPDPDSICVSKHGEQKPARLLLTCFKKELAVFYFKMMASWAYGSIPQIFTTKLEGL